MTLESKIARSAGLLYLITFVTGMFSLVYVPSHIFVSHDLPATIDQIIASQTLFRVDVASSLIMQVAFLLLPLVLYQLLRSVNQTMAMLMVALAVVSVPIGLTSLSHRLDVLSLLSNASLTHTVTPELLQFSVKQSLDAYGNGLQITNLFWGLWLLPFGYLVVKSGFLPKVLGGVLIIGGFGYIDDVFGDLLMAHYADSFLAPYVLLPAMIGEVGMILWLLLVGVRHPRTTNTSQALRQNT